MKFITYYLARTREYDSSESDASRAIVQFVVAIEKLDLKQTIRNRVFGKCAYIQRLTVNILVTAGHKRRYRIC